MCMTLSRDGVALEVLEHADAMARIMRRDLGLVYVLCRTPEEIADCVEARPEIEAWLEETAYQNAWLAELWAEARAVRDARTVGRVIDGVLRSRDGGESTPL